MSWVGAAVLIAAVVLLSLLAVALVSLALWRRVKELGRATSAATTLLGEVTARLERPDAAPRVSRPYP